MFVGFQWLSPFSWNTIHHVDGTGYMLRAGDGACYVGNCHHQFVSLGASPAVYYLAMELVERGPHARLGGMVPAGPRRRL